MGRSPIANRPKSEHIWILLHAVRSRRRFKDAPPSGPITITTRKSKHIHRSTCHAEEGTSGGSVDIR